MPLPNTSDASHHLRGEIQSPCMVFPFSFSSLTIFPPIIPFWPRVILFNSLNALCSLPRLCSERAVSLSKEVVCVPILPPSTSIWLLFQQGHVLWVAQQCLDHWYSIGAAPTVLSIGLCRLCHCQQSAVIAFFLVYLPLNIRPFQLDGFRWHKVPIKLQSSAWQCGWIWLLLSRAQIWEDEGFNVFESLWVTWPF